MKLYSFVTSKEKPLSDFITCSQDGLSPSVHKGGYVVVVKNQKGTFEMHYSEKRTAKIFYRAIAYAKYPANKSDINIL